MGIYLPAFYQLNRQFQNILLIINLNDIQFYKINNIIDPVPNKDDKRKSLI
jgi:hypothetical protein